MKLKQRIIYTVLFAGVLIAGGILTGTLVKHKLQNNLVNNYSQEETLIGHEVANTLGGKIQNIQNSLEALALDPSIESSNAQTCNAALQRAISAINLGIGNLGRVNDKGTFYCSINKALIGLPASKLGTYVAQLINDPQHNPVMSHEITVPGVKGYLVAIHVPVYDANHVFIGTLGGAIYLNQLAASYLNSVKFAQTGYASLQDDNGDILYSHIKGRIGENYFSPAVQTQNAELKDLNKGILAAHNGTSSVVRYVNSSGVHKIASIVPFTVVPNHRWIVLVNVPISEIVTTYLHTGLNQAFNVLTIIYCVAVLLTAMLMIAGTLRDAKLKRAEDQFISLVSHQLRTPLTAIRLFAEMLDKGQVGTLSLKQDEYVGMIHVSTLRMIRLVGDILNVSRLELNRLKVVPEATDFMAYIKDYLDEVMPLAQEHHIVVDFKPGKGDISAIKLDRTLFGQVLHNLLTNAIRYSKPEHGKVTITMAQKKKHYELVIADNGIGIPKSAQKHIFDRFYRADNAKLAVGEGTGLGLYLVKLILLQTGGAIRLVSKENHGTTFYVTIPLSGMSAKDGEKSLENEL
jgi:signal transduction histidine kinase